ncbi:MAG: PAS domain S-box protein, partial [Candidatus Omnitrophica bacterium]|nr:PAS domain S-box protein [Candidatus Omnitrophota bacterium]
MERELRTSEKQFRLLADTAPVMIWMSDPKGRIEFFNEPWLCFRGRSREEETGAGWLEGVHPDDAESLKLVFASAVRSRKSFRTRFRMRRVDGMYCWMLNTGVPRLGGDGEFAGHTGSCIDITDIKRLEELKDEFVSNVSHELRTPLSITREGICLVLDRILGPVGEKQEEVLQTARDNIDRLARIINNLLDISKIEAGKVELRRDLFDIRIAAQKVADAFDPTFRSRSLKMVKDVPEGPVYVFADLDRIIQVFTNLVGNALKFTQEGSVTLGIKETQKQVELWVRDTGAGIAPGDLPKVFDKFEQIGRVPGAGEKGTGLGLTIARPIVGLHGGAI